MFKHKLKILIGIFTLKWLFITLLVVAIFASFWSLFTWFTTILFSLKPPSTATTLSYYQSDSFFWLPIDINDKNTDSIFKKWFFWKEEEIKKIKLELNAMLNWSLKVKFWNKYNAEFWTFENWFNWYNNFVNISNWLENNIPFWISITNNDLNIKESIFFYTKIDERWTVSKYYEKFDNLLKNWKWENDLWYKSPTDSNFKLMFLKQDLSTNINTQFYYFYNNLWNALWNDWKTRDNTKEAYEYLFKYNNEDDNISSYLFYPKEYNDIILPLNKATHITTSCKVTYTNEKDDFDCADWVASIKITSINNSILPLSNFNEGIEIKNVKGVWYNAIRAKIAFLTKLIIENNEIKLNDSYLIDMANFVWLNGSEASNQKVLAQQKIDLSDFSWKQFGKDYKNIIINAWVLQLFSEDNAKKLLQYKEQDDTSFTTISGEKNKVEIFKNKWGYSTPWQKYKCIKWRYVVYKNFEELIFWTTITDDIIPKKCNASPWNAPWLLKQAEIKYYKKFLFKWELFTKNLVNWSWSIQVGKLYDLDKYRLNYFYHYEKPNIKSDNNKETLSNVDYISHIGLDKQSIIWRGIYLKVFSYAWELKDNMPWTFSIKRDSKDGSILLPNSPVKFELGLLTELDKTDIIYVKSGDDFIKKEVENKESIWFMTSNMDKDAKDNQLLSKYSNGSIFDKINYKEFFSNEFLQFDIPAIYGEKKIKEFNNEYITLLDKQKKIIDILDKKFLWKTGSGGYTWLSVDWVLKKYMTLYSTYPWMNNNLNICIKYKPISRIGDFNEDKESNYTSFDISLNNIRKSSIKKISNIYYNCMASYYKQGRINNYDNVKIWEGKMTLQDHMETKYGLTYNTIYRYPLASLNTVDNDIYFLYKELNKPEYDDVLLDDEKADKWIDWYIKFYTHWFSVTNDGLISNVNERSRVAELYKKISNVNESIIYNSNPENEFKENISDSDRYYIEQEYLWMEIVGDEISEINKENFLKLTDKTLKINDNTNFFDIKKAFSLDKKTYNKDLSVNEIPLNPNVYLYSFFHYTMKSNKSYNINITNEWKLMHYWHDYNKYELDKEFLFWYSDQISWNVLNEMTLQSYRNIYIALNSDSFKWGWNLNDFNPLLNEETLTELSAIANSSINKIWFVDTFLRNSTLYSWQWTFKNESIDWYIPSTLKIPSKYLKNEYDLSKNNWQKWRLKKVNQLWKFILQIKLTNLISKYDNEMFFYKKVNNKEWIKRTTIRLDVLNYIMAISTWYYNKNERALFFNSFNWYNVEEILRFVIKDYFEHYYPEEYKEREDLLMLKQVIKWPESDVYYNTVLGEIITYIYAWTSPDNDPYLNNSYFEDNKDNKELRDFAKKYLWRYENPSWKYSKNTLSNSYINYELIKKSFEKILSQTQSWTVSNTWSNNVNSDTGILLPTSAWPNLSSIIQETLTWINNTSLIWTGGKIEAYKVGDISSEIEIYKFKTSWSKLLTFNNTLIRDIENLRVHFSDIDHIAKLQHLSTDVLIKILQNNKNCMDFLKEKSSTLYYWLYVWNYDNETLERINWTWGLSNEERLIIYSYLQDKNLLICKDMNISDYKTYLDYVGRQFSYLKSQKSILSLSNVQEFNLFTWINYINSKELTYTFGDKQVSFQWNSNDVKNIPIYKTLFKMFNYNKDKWSEINKKNTYKFVATTSNGIPIKINESKQYQKGDIMNVYFQLLMAETISNNIGLYEWLKTLSTEFFNYSLSNDKNIIANISEFKNLWPLYSLYTNNWYVNPNNWVSFVMVSVNQWNWVSNNLPLSLQGLSMSWDKSAINDWLNNLNQTYCNQIEINKKDICKKYIEYLKWMSLADYKQELDWLDMYIWMKEITWSYPSVWHRINWPFVITHSTATKRIKNTAPNIYSRMQQSYKWRKANVYVWQCTWNVHLYKDWDLWWNGRDYYNKAFNADMSVQNYSWLPIEEKLKIIQVWDIISFFWWPDTSWCNTSWWAWEFWHVAVVVWKDNTKKTITIAESNYASLFIMNTRTLNAEVMCDWGVIHNVKKRYETSGVVFSQWPLVKDNNSWTWITAIEDNGKKDPNSIAFNVWVYDLSKDTSLTKFVSRNYSFADLQYIPPIIKIPNTDKLIFTKTKQILQLRKEAWDALTQMANDFYTKFNVPIKVVSWYRSYDYQVWIKWTFSNPKSWCPDDLCSFAWRSEHQTWLAVDLFEVTSKEEFLSKANLTIYYTWLNDNAYKYWFHNSYQKGSTIDWYQAEPWHWRYLWVQLSTELRTQWLTFTEYVDQNAIKK